jgi:hypothetical protein
MADPEVLGGAKEAPPWFSRQFDLPPATNVVYPNGQKPVVLLKVKLAGYYFREKLSDPIEQFVLVDLSNTIISPGNLSANRDDKRGAFTDRVQLRVWFENEPRLVVRHAGPASSSEGGSSSKSMSYSVGAGFFGETGTGNVGWTISSGVTVQLPDFEIQKNVGAERGSALNHTYQLKLIEGAQYNYPIDAVDLSSSGRVRTLPPKATHDLDIFSSVLFHSDQAIKAKRQLRVQLVHRLVKVEKTFGIIWSPLTFKPQKYDPSRENQAQHSILGCTLGQVTIDTQPASATYDWKFEVDLDKGGVSLL